MEVIRRHRFWLIAASAVAALFVVRYFGEMASNAIFPSSAITLSADETDLDRCPTDAVRPTLVQVDDLPDSSPVECDLVGFDLMFPDGHVVEVPQASVGESSFPEGADYTVTNLGVYGIHATYRARDVETMEWGTPEAKELVAKAEGALD